MSQTAHVTSIEALESFRATYLKFAEEVKEALCSIELEARHLCDRISREYGPQWARALRDRQEELNQAKNELARKQMMKNAAGERPDVMYERKLVRRAEERVKEAQQKIENCKQWANYLLPKAINEYSGPARQLNALIEGEPPPAVLMLDRILKSLEDYMALMAPSMGPGPGTRTAPDMGSAAMPTEPEAAPAPAAATEEVAAPSTE